MVLKNPLAYMQGGSVSGTAETEVARFFGKRRSVPSSMLNCNLLPRKASAYPILPMERAARVFRNAKQSRSLLTDDQVLSAVWPAAVGKAIAAHTSRLRVVRTILVIEVEDAIWQRQLRTLEKQILDRVHLFTPDLALAGVEVRIGVPRREPQKATAPTSSAREPLFAAFSSDEADRIRDPVLKRIFQISRRKASA